jgi:CheY-like chemotaxis protein
VNGPRPVDLLLVEDNAADAMLAAEFVRETGIKAMVTVATDGEKAITLLFRAFRCEIGTPDLILLDINIPKRNGYDVLRYVRESGKDIPVIIYTGSRVPDEKARALANGAKGYITKPIGSREMDETIAAFREAMLAALSRSRQRAGRLA